MASKLYGQFMLSALNKEVDWDSDDIRVALINTGTMNQDDHRYFSDVAGSEISGTGYTEGGQAVTNKAMTYDGTNNAVVLTGDDVVWENSTLTARAAVVYDATAGSPDAQPLIGFVDFGSEQSSNNGNFTITWDASGIVRLTAA